MEWVQLSLDILLLLFLVALFAGFIDTLAGGGGLLTIPALMLTGMPPIVALGTNKLQGCVGTGTATLTLLFKARLSWTVIYPIMISAAIGSLFGAIVVHYMSADYLQWLIPVVISAIAVYFLLRKNIDQSTQPIISNRLYSRLVIPIIGAYDGALGPATGTFFMTSAVVLRGQRIVEATINAKPLNFTTNIAALAVFVATGNFAWSAALAMLLGQIIGAWVASHYLIAINPALLKRLVVSVCLLMLTAYLYRAI